MHRRKRISPVLIIAGIVVVVAVGILLMGRLDFPGRVLRAISSLVPSNAEKPLESEEVEDYRAMVRDLERENTILREMLLQYRSEDAISKLEPSFGYPVLP
ncbi:MAG TPA: hypothetical protein ENN67_04630, partial [Firmicutes bacterium]|nr:hypothetical protein [Bacillota bacterium]